MSEGSRMARTAAAKPCMQEPPVSGGESAAQIHGRSRTGSLSLASLVSPVGTRGPRISLSLATLQCS
jgi:hypothetical protein